MDGRSRARDSSDHHPIPVPKWSSVRTNRLLFSGTRLVFNFTRLGIWYRIGDLVFIIDMSMTGLLILWDILEKFCLKRDTPYAMVSLTTIAIEAIIPPIIVTLLCLAVWVTASAEDASYWVHQGEEGYGRRLISSDISIHLLWVPVAILSGILFYHLLRDYARSRSNQKLRPILMFTQTGDPVAIIPRAPYTNESASRFSIDSLIQNSEGPVS
ncbi:hypothetical protein K445DRAFT_136569 [Daldinia sp. EC12]|nr:hypothetical protein K445DRAFT_136569 [Daldinia sp. EC12]